MIKMFKSVYIMYLVAGITGGFLIILLYALQIGCFKNNIPMLIICLLIWVLMCVLYFYKKAINKLNKLNLILLNECNSYKYINELTRVLSDNKKYNVHLNYYLLLAQGYLFKGDMQYAKDAFDKIHIREGGANYITGNFLYNKYLSLYYIQMNDVINADKAMGLCKSFYMKLKQPAKQKYLMSYMTSVMMLNVFMGEYEGTEQLFNMLYDVTDYEIDKVTAKFYLGKYYVYTKQMDMAKEAFTYVKDKGGDLIYSAKAKEYLNSICI